jgi:hypothetical protein
VLIHFNGDRAFKVSLWKWRGRLEVSLKVAFNEAGGESGRWMLTGSCPLKGICVRNLEPLGSIVTVSYLVRS